MCAEIQLWGYRDTSGGTDIQLGGIDIQQGYRETAGVQRYSWGYKGTAGVQRNSWGYIETAGGTKVQWGMAMRGGLLYGYRKGSENKAVFKDHILKGGSAEQLAKILIKVEKYLTANTNIC